MKRIKVMLFCVLISIMVPYVWADDVMTYRDSGSQIDIGFGQEFVIEVNVKPMDNYEWQFAKPYDQNILSLISSEYVPEGAGVGKNLFRFKAVGKGMAMVSIKFSRSGEKDMYPLDSKAFIINVR